MPAATLPPDKPTAAPRCATQRHRSPAVARVGLATLYEARELIEPALHSPERRSDAERVSANLDHLIAVARERSWPL